MVHLVFPSDTKRTMANAFGVFVTSSPLSSLPHDPAVTLASNCIRETFGPVVQAVADCLNARGSSSTLHQLISTIRSKCRRVWNEERERLVIKGKYKLHRARGPAAHGWVVEAPSIRAALLILIQHDLVEAIQEEKATTYKLISSRARLLPRYPRFVEYVKKALDETAASLIEEFLIHGRMRTVDAVVHTVNQSQDLDSRYTQRQAVVEAFRRLVEGGFIEQVLPVKVEETCDMEFEGDNVTTKVKEEASTATPDNFDEDPAVVALLTNSQYKTLLPRHTIWRVSLKMFHDSIRSFSLGRLVAERFGQKVMSCGSMVTAALKLAAHKEHALKVDNFEERTSFSLQEIVPYLPKPVQQALENKPGGLLNNLSKAFVEMAQLTYPRVVEEIEEAAGPNGGKFSIATRQLVEHLQERIIHQVIYDSQGEVAARVCSILRIQGHLESDAVAEAAMVPAKDTREVLHSLYRHNYISLLSLPTSKQHNYATIIYLWCVSNARSLKTVRENVNRALTNIRLRRQHEVDVGKEWIERAKEAGLTDENENEHDKSNYNKFCQGLERLDNAILHLDETLMVLIDF